MTDAAALRGLATRVVHRTPFMVLREDEIQRLDGSRGRYSFLEKVDFALVIPREDDGFHLVEQYRYPTRRRSWEFPQGTFRHPRASDDLVALAIAELEEETGLRAASMQPLGCLHIAPGLTSQGGHVFLATRLTPGPPQRELEEQDMRQRWVPRADFERMVREGRITDGPTIAAYTLLLLHGG